MQTSVESNLFELCRVQPTLYKWRANELCRVQPTLSRHRKKEHSFIMGVVQTHKDLLVWQKSMVFAKAIYQLTRNYPADERLCLVSQMRRAAVSVPSNIAEGYGRQSAKELCRFLSIALGSVSELETQILLSFDFGYLSNTQKDELCNLSTELAKMISSLIRTVSTKPVVTWYSSTKKLIYHFKQDISVSFSRLLVYLFTKY